MAKVRITPNSTYAPGHVASILAIVAPGPMGLEADGSVIVQMSDDQREAFLRRGGAAHKVETLPELDPPSAVAGTGPAAEPETAEVNTFGIETKIETPTLWETHQQYVEDCRRRGMNDDQIIDSLINAGWKESQAIDLVINQEPNPPAAA